MSMPISGVGAIYAPAAGDYEGSPYARDLDYYLAPSRGASAQDKIVWLQDMVNEGLTLLKDENAYPSLATATDIITGAAIQATPGAVSTAVINTSKRATQEAVAIMSNIRAFWNVIPNNHKDEQWVEQARILNGYHSHLYHNTHFPLKLKEGLEYAYVQGTGYLSPVWSPHYWSRFEGEIDCHTGGAMYVLPVQMYRKNLQSAYVTIIQESIPITHLADMFGKRAESVNANRGSSVAMLADAARSFFASLTGTQRRRDKSGNVEVIYAYISDRTLNRGDKPIRMGDWKDGRPQNSWSYEVPPLGKIFATGWRQDGMITTKVADENDSLLYPQKRLMIAAADRLFYDGPSFFWHGRHPAIKLTMDEWAWDYLGLSIIMETLSLTQGHTDMLRGIIDLVNTKLNPPIMGNSRLVSRKLLKAFNPRQWGRNKLWVPMDQGDPIKPAIDPRFLTLEAFYPDFLDKVSKMVKDIFGLPGLEALAKARQIPGEGSIEKLASVSGDILMMREHMLNQALTEYGAQVTSHIFQFADTRRRLSILGSDGVTEEDFDYEPGNLIPARLPFEPEARDDKDRPLKDVYMSTRGERARSHARNFRFTVKAGSTLQMTALQNKLMKVQARKISPLAMDVQTLSESLFEGQEWGDLKTLLEKVKDPSKLTGNNVGERAILEHLIMQEIEKSAQIKQAMTELMVQALAAQLGGGDQSAPSSGGGSEGGAAPGRPNVDTAAPALKQKGDGRSTITTSK